MSISASEAITRAQPYLDAIVEPTRWAPSELLRIGWHMLETGRGGVAAADAWLSDMLDEARNRYAAGFYANPFAEPAQPRNASS